ncbi:MAG: hypothetical protein ABF979_04225 [Gluconobacter sp.]|uniref:hypothetical protein n=1 Tax=Gluconobacter sp. TaxID=1876758 RepID=UPI0039EB163A
MRTNGKPAAMYVSPAFDYIYVRNSEGIQFPKGYDDAKVVISGAYKESAFHSKINELVLDDIPLKDVDVVLLAKASTQMVEGRPIVGVLGRAALFRFTVHIRVGEKKKRVSLDPDLTYTTFPSFWISSLKENPEDQKKFTHYDDFLSVGQGALVKNLFMGGSPIENEKIFFHDEVEIGSLGLPFFAAHSGNVSVQDRRGDVQ